MKTSHLCLLPLALWIAVLHPSTHAQQPIVDETLVFAEKDGTVAVEAEHFFKQTSTDQRAFYLTHSALTPDITPDGDPQHTAGASGGAYLEILPDTRRTHADKLIRGENFSPQPGQQAVLHYKIHFSAPGKYYVWARAHSTGSEDNGLHVGIDGQWPESGQRMQWCDGKHQWTWQSKQRTEQQHCGEPYKIFLEVPEAGVHTVQFSMREDGFEFDKFILTTQREFPHPQGLGPHTMLHQGKLPKPFPFIEPSPPVATVAAQPVPDENADANNNSNAVLLDMPAAMFANGKQSGYYVHNQWLAIKPDTDKSGYAERTFPYPTGRYHVTLQTVGENDGRSQYAVSVDGDKIGDYTNPLSDQTYEHGSKFNHTWRDVAITEGAIIKVASTIGTNDGKEFSRARWSGVRFTPADEATRRAAAPTIAELAKQRTTPATAATPQGSPTKSVSDQPLQMPRGADGDGTVHIDGQKQAWHKLTLNLAGPYAHEKDNAPNPFTDYRLTVTFQHADGTQYTVPGYFAADGDAANTSAEAGNTWRAHFAPDRTGAWSYQVSFQQGKHAALDADAAAQPLAAFDGKQGTFKIAASDKQGRDLRGQGRLRYVGKHYLQFAGTGKYFLKVGADAPETLLAYSDFDNTIAGNPKKAPLKSWSPHVQDWQPGDPTWGQGEGKGLIGAINYLSSKGCNAFSFLTYNAGGDGDNVWPFIQREDKLHYDCSKLDQWGTVFDHGTARGMYLHFKMQETENDDHKKGKGGGRIDESLDGGDLGVQRKLYCRELIARFGHNLALNWNLGEENTQSTAQQQAMINYIANLDAYGHNIVVHTFPGEQDKVYRPLLGDRSRLTGVSLQNSSLETTHEQTAKWVRESAEAGKPWIVAFDESGSAAHAQCPDLGYKGFDGHDRSGKMVYTQHKVRKQTLWGNLMAGGAGCEYYFGYQFDENDILCEDWRSRDQSWDYCRIAIGFFHDNNIPFWEMTNADALVGNPKHAAGKFCFAKAGEIYLVYLPEGGAGELDMTAADGQYDVKWFNPRQGGELLAGSVRSVSGGQRVSLGAPPADVKEDWLVVVRRR